MAASGGGAATGFSFVPPREVRAGPLVCRRWEAADEQALLDAVAASLDHLRPWMPWSKGYELADAKEFLSRNALGPSRRGDEAVTDAAYAICDSTGRVIGSCGLHGRVGPAAVEIGYWVHVGHIRRGVATLAAAMLTEAALNLPAVEEVEIHHDRANMASGAIPAALGYTHVATVTGDPEAPGESGVELQWRMRREELPESRAASLLEEARR
jgi:ribosomal-protein-serine acetyltransferase